MSIPEALKQVKNMDVQRMSGQMGTATPDASRMEK